VDQCTEQGVKNRERSFRGNKAIQNRAYASFLTQLLKKMLYQEDKVKQERERHKFRKPAIQPRRKPEGVLNRTIKDGPRMISFIDLITSCVVREFILFGFNPLKFFDLCFMIELCLHGKYAFKENVYSIVFG
jgi:predicted nuclease of restriction endonuclease-like (RecB) superfamily